MEIADFIPTRPTRPYLGRAPLARRQQPLGFPGKPLERQHNEVPNQALTQAHVPYQRWDCGMQSPAIKVENRGENRAKSRF
jgi:hypothetical protein